MASTRPELLARGCIFAEAMRGLPDGRVTRVAALVTLRQRPGTAKGTIFLTLEDETGMANVIVWPGIYAAHRRATLHAGLLAMTGRVQAQGKVVNLVARAITDESALLSGFSLASRDFR